MKRTAGAALAAIFAVLGAATVVAQTDPIAARMALMKGNNDNAIVVVQMVKGQAAFDAGKVDAAFAQWAETAQKLPNLFPDNSKTGRKTRAAPKIWMTKADFDAKAAEFAKVVAGNRDKAKASLDGLRAAVPVVADACDNCHKDYRLAKQ